MSKSKDKRGGHRFNKRDMLADIGATSADVNAINAAKSASGASDVPTEASTLPTTYVADTPAAKPSVAPSQLEHSPGANSPADEVQQIGASTEEIQALAKQDLDFLAALIMPLVFKFNFPPVFKEGVWTWLLGFIHQTRVFPQLALGLPRGFGKSTLMKVFLVYCILFTDRKFLLIVASTAKKAENILSDVIGMLEEPNIKATFGDWKLGVTKDTQALKNFAIEYFRMSHS